MTTLKLADIRKHNISLAVNKVGIYDPNDIRNSVEENLVQFHKEIVETRLGLLKDHKTDRKLPGKDISLDQASKKFFGCDAVTLLMHLGIDMQRMTIQDMAEHVGYGSFDKAILYDSLRDRVSYGSGGVTSTKDFPSDFRFIIPEIFATAIRIGYDGGAMHMNWVANTQPMATRKLTIPQILRGDGNPSVVAEGGTIPKGSVRFGKKDVSVFKVGTGFSMTDELMYESTIDMLFTFLQEVGIDMSIGADVEAIRVLVNGEQADGSEAAPVVGVGTTGTYAYKDIKRIFTRMNRLKNPSNRIIANEDDGIDVTGIDRFEGFQGETKLASIRSIIGVPEAFDIDTHVVPTGKLLFVSPGRAMIKLQYRSMTMEQDRNIDTQETEMVVSDHVGFAILRNDARVLLDKNQLFSAAPFPAGMNIDGRISQAFAN